MTRNMGTIDRLIRVLFALVVVVLFFTNQIAGTTVIILGILGLVFLLTSFMSFCPLYLPFRISTMKKQSS